MHAGSLCQHVNRNVQRALGKVQEPVCFKYPVNSPQSQFLGTRLLYSQGINYCLPLLTSIITVDYQFRIPKIVGTELEELVHAPVCPSRLHTPFHANTDVKPSVWTPEIISAAEVDAR